MPEVFETAVVGATGERPGIPNTWSFSSLIEAEDCPRRWMLSRARYPQIWDKRGFPEAPHDAAILGSVVHRSVETVLDAFRKASASSVLDDRATDVLLELGGLTTVVETVIEDELSRLVGNPRAEPRVRSIRRYLSVRVQEIRTRVQTLLSRVELVASPGTGSSGAAQGATPNRFALRNGSFTEIDLEARDLRLAGRADLVTVEDERCTITDFKTGAEKDSHVDQLRLYALLWFLDAERNPTCVPARGLELMYQADSVQLPAPSVDELRQIQEETRRRIEEAEQAISVPRPEARPSQENCKFCSVRQLCEEYWEPSSRVLDADLDTEPPDYVDCELSVGDALGPRSWRVLESSPAGINVLIAGGADRAFSPGERIRVLGARSVSDPDGEGWTASVSSAADTFVLRDEAPDG